MINVLDARRRSTTLTCIWCGGSGASIGCVVSKCKNNYHLPCAFRAGALLCRLPYDRMYAGGVTSSSQSNASTPSFGVRYSPYRIISNLFPYEEIIRDLETSPRGTNITNSMSKSIDSVITTNSMDSLDSYNQNPALDGSSNDLDAESKAAAMDVSAVDGDKGAGTGTGHILHNEVPTHVPSLHSQSLTNTGPNENPTHHHTDHGMEGHQHVHPHPPPPPPQPMPSDGSHDSNSMDVATTHPPANGHEMGTTKTHHTYSSQPDVNLKSAAGSSSLSYTSNTKLLSHRTSIGHALFCPDHHHDAVGHILYPSDLLDHERRVTLVEVDRKEVTLRGLGRRLLPPVVYPNAARGIRYGTLTVHCYGETVLTSEMFADKYLLYPRGYQSSRSYWSYVHPGRYPMTLAIIRFEIFFYHVNLYIFLSNAQVCFCHVCV